MPWSLELVVDGKPIDHILVSHSNRFEIEVLEAVFPKKYWSYWNPKAATWFADTPRSKNQPPVFDFLGNEESAKAAMKEYYDKTEDLQEDSDYDSRLGWERTFWKLYKTGMALQMQGKEPRVNIG